MLKRSSKETPKKKHKKLKIILGVIGTLIIILGSLAFYFQSKLNKVSTPKTKYKTTLRKTVPKATDPIGVLLIGTDDSASRGDEGGRSDTLIYATVNPKTNKTHLYSISRDIYSWVDDNNYQKINAAYSIGKEQQCARAVEKLLDSPVDYYVSVNMDALVQIVDSLGGIDVENKFDFPISITDTEPEYQETIDVGKQHINGRQALVYARMRHQDPEGDVGRQKRQQEVIRQITKKLKSPKTLMKADELLNIVSNNIKTNAPRDKIVNLFKSYVKALSDIQSTNIVGRGEMIEEGYYMIVGKYYMLETQNNIKKELGLRTKTKLSWIDDEDMLYVDDTVLPLDTGTHYDFNGFHTLYPKPKKEDKNTISTQQTQQQQPKVETKPSTPKVEQKVEAKAPEAPKSEAPKSEAPKVETPQPAPKVETPPSSSQPQPTPPSSSQPQQPEKPKPTIPSSSQTETPSEEELIVE